MKGSNYHKSVSWDASHVIIACHCEGKEDFSVFEGLLRLGFMINGEESYSSDVKTGSYKLQYVAEQPCSSGRCEKAVLI